MKMNFACFFHPLLPPVGEMFHKGDLTVVDCPPLAWVGGGLIVFLIKTLYHFIWLIFLLFPSFLLSQNAQIDTAKYYWDATNYDSAFALFKEIQVQSKELQDWETWQLASQFIARYHTRMNQFQQAHIAFEEAISNGEKHLADTNTVLLDTYNWLGYLQMFEGRFDAAIQNHEHVLQKRLRTAHSADALADSYGFLGTDYYAKESYPQARELLQQSLELRETIEDGPYMDLVVAHNTLGMLNHRLGDYQAALNHYHKALDVMEPHVEEGNSNRLLLINNLSNSYDRIKDYEKANYYYQQILPHISSSPVIEQITFLYNLAIGLNQQGEYDQALMHLQRVLDIKAQTAESLAHHTAMIYHEMGRTYVRKQDYPNGLAFYQKAIDACEKGGEGLQDQLAYSHLAIGELYITLEQYQKAYDHFGKASVIWQKQLGPESEKVAHTHYYLGEVLWHMGAKSRAYDMLFKALRSYQRILGEHHPETAATHNKIAELSCKDGNFMKGVAEHQTALKSLLPAYQPLKIPKPDILTSNWRQLYVDDVLMETARSYATYGRAQDDLALLDTAFGYYEVMMAYIDSFRYSYQDPSSRQDLIRTYMDFFEEYIDLGVDLYRRTANFKYLNKAFGVVEKSKSMGLLEAIRSHKAIRFAGLPDSLVAKEQNLKREVAFWEEEIMEAAEDSFKLPGLRDQLFHRKNEYLSLKQLLEEKYHDYYALIFPAEAIDFYGFGKSLNKGVAAYTYFWGKEKIFVFIAFDGKYSVRELDVKIYQKLDVWLDFISHPPDLNEDQIAFYRLGEELYRMLLPEIPDAKELLIIPDGKLGYLSFESLISSFDVDGGNCEWLVEKMPVSYAWSADLWLETRNKQKQHVSYDYLGFAPEFGNGKRQYPQLTGSRKAIQLSSLTHNAEEVTFVNQLLTGQSFVGDRATESMLKNLGSRARILHFATHAWMDDSDPLNSRLFLSQDSDTTEDGLLHIYEIYHQYFPADLAVLSACETAAGPLQRGEGIMSLARAFQYAGCNSLLTSQWQTDDLAASKLTQSFFRHLKEGKSKSEALQLARQQWIQTSDKLFGHPYFWAGFVLIGENGPVEFRSGWGKWLVLGTFLVVIAGLAIYLILTGRKGRLIFAKNVEYLSKNPKE